MSSTNLIADILGQETAEDQEFMKVALPLLHRRLEKPQALEPFKYMTCGQFMEYLTGKGLGDCPVSVGEVFYGLTQAIIHADDEEIRTLISEYEGRVG